MSRSAPLLVVLVLAGALVVLQRQLGDHPWDQLPSALADIGPGRVLLAVAATVASYLAMTGYDALALRYVEFRLPYRRFAAASFVATAFGNSLGASAVVGAALRARVYSSWGVPAFAITRIAGFNLVTLALGCLVLGAVGVLLAPQQIAAALGVSVVAVAGLGVVLLAAAAGYLAWCGDGKAPLAVRGWRIDRPSRRLALAQVGLSTLEWLLMAAVLYALLPDQGDGGVGFALFATVFVVATVAGLVSNVPGGLGVFEVVLLTGLGGGVAPAELVTALVAYRIVYYLVPLTLAGVLLGGLEARRGTTADDGLLARVGVLTPPVMSLGVAAMGVALVLTGQLPGYPTDGDRPPVPSVLPDLTPFTGSLAGIGLLLLARGLTRRLRGALVATVAVLMVVLVMAATHAAPGFAAAALLLAALLVLSRAAFTRSTSMLSDPRGWAWMVTVTGSCTALVWWHQVWSTSHGMAERTWLQASVGPDTPAGLRLGLSVGVLALVVGGTRLQSPGVDGPAAATIEELDRAAPILDAARNADASLLWTGDKRVLFSGKGNALLMYQIEGRTWVVMSDPVGAEDEFEDLLWRFVELCDRNCGRPVFYCVRADLAELYRRCGLAMSKLGEEATIPLDGFTMAGSARAKLRSEVRGSVRAGVEVEVLEPERVPGVLAELRVVSDAWLAGRNAREKSFSLGAFEEDYIARFPVAVARLDGAVVAFASLWVSGARNEVKVDLMRRLSEAPNNVMSHLFVESMTWAKDQGFATFSLGMAPLSGLDTDGAATFWDRVGHFLWTHGEHFYNFQGLRRFKQRFDPHWETRYIATPGGPALPVMMLNVATLVGGGLRGMIAR